MSRVQHKSTGEYDVERKKVKTACGRWVPLAQAKSASGQGVTCRRCLGWTIAEEEHSNAIVKALEKGELNVGLHKAGFTKKS